MRHKGVQSTPPAHPTPHPPERSKERDEKGVKSHSFLCQAPSHTVSQGSVIAVEKMMTAVKAKVATDECIMTCKLVIVSYKVFSVP